MANHRESPVSIHPAHGPWPASAQKFYGRANKVRLLVTHRSKCHSNPPLGFKSGDLWKCWNLGVHWTQGWVQLRNCTCNWLQTKGVIVIVIEFKIWKSCVIVIDFIGVIDVIDSIILNYSKTNIFSSKLFSYNLFYPTSTNIWKHYLKNPLPKAHKSLTY